MPEPQRRSQIPHPRQQDRGRVIFFDQPGALVSGRDWCAVARLKASPFVDGIAQFEISDRNESFPKVFNPSGGFADPPSGIIWALASVL